MKIYLDTSVLNRPFDDPVNETIRNETEAIDYVLSLVRLQVYEFVSSQALLFEIHQTKEQDIRKELIAIEATADRFIYFNKEIIQRATRFIGFNLSALDALHLASAEGRVDILFTVDKGFLKKSNKIPNLNVVVINPLTWIS